MYLHLNLYNTVYDLNLISTQRMSRQNNNILVLPAKTSQSNYRLGSILEPEEGRGFSYEFGQSHIIEVWPVQ